MTFSDHLTFFNQGVLDTHRDEFKQSVSKSDISSLSNGNDSKSLSIFSALDKNKDGTIDNSELQSAFDNLKSFAASDRDKQDISVEEMQQYLKTLKDANGKSLDESNIKPIDMFNFINEHVLQKKIQPPRYILILEMLSGDKGLKDNIATNALQNLQHYEDLLSDYTNKYNYVGIESSDEAIQDMQEVISKYFDEYGTSLASSSRESILTNDIAEDTGTKYHNIRNGKSVESKADWLNLKERIKENNFANCGECQMMILDILHENFGNKYEYSAINIKCKIADDRCAIGNETHCAVLLKDKNGKEYVIDPWLNPRDGGIFTKSDWENLVTDIYITNSHELVIKDDILEKITREDDQ